MVCFPLYIGIVSCCAVDTVKWAPKDGMPGPHTGIYHGRLGQNIWLGLLQPGVVKCSRFPG